MSINNLYPLFKQKLEIHLHEDIFKQTGALIKSLEKIRQLDISALGSNPTSTSARYFVDKVPCNKSSALRYSLKLDEPK